EVSEFLGITANTSRYYERGGLIEVPRSHGTSSLRPEDRRTPRLPRPHALIGHRHQPAEPLYRTGPCQRDDNVPAPTDHGRPARAHPRSDPATGTVSGRNGAQDHRLRRRTVRPAAPRRPLMTTALGDLTVSPTCFGCMALSHVDGGHHRHGARAALSTVLGDGITFLDTADVYGEPRTAPPDQRGRTRKCLPRSSQPAATRSNSPRNSASPLSALEPTAPRNAPTDGRSTHAQRAM